LEQSGGFIYFVIIGYSKQYQNPKNKDPYECKGVVLKVKKDYAPEKVKKQAQPIYRKSLFLGFQGAGSVLVDQGTADAHKHKKD